MRGSFAPAGANFRHVEHLHTPLPSSAAIRDRPADGRFQRQPACAQASHSSGQVKLNKDLDSSIEGKTVLVVEDILDTGLTLQYLLRILQQRKPKHLRIAVLLDKVERRIANVHADYVGFAIPNEFVVGFGLDFAERYRNLPNVGILKLPSAD